MAAVFVEAVFALVVVILQTRFVLGEVVVVVVATEM